MSILDRLTIATRALGAALTAAADSLDEAAQAAPPASTVSTPPPPAPAAPPSPSPSPAPTTDPVTATLLDSIRAVMAAPEPPPRKRRAIIPRRHRPEGPGCDYVDEDGTRFLNQRGTCERLRLRPQHVVALEESGRLQRHLVHGRVGYRVEDIDALVAKMQAFERAQAQAAADGNGACAVKA